VAGAVCAAEHFAVGLDAMADNPAATVDANWRQGVDRTLEAIENVYVAVEVNLKRLVIVVTADFTGWHRGSPDE
jgi:hypothetical protein